MPWTKLFCSLLGCYHGRIPEHCTLTVSALTYWTHLETHTQDHTRTHTPAHIRTHAHKQVNALTKTRESPMERLFRGITWLLGNSVALPWRPSYFRLQYLFVFVCVCVSVCLSIRFHVLTAQLLACVSFYIYIYIYIHINLQYMCVCVCITVSDLRGK